MKTSVTISVIIGIILGTMFFPMIMIPLVGIGVVVAAIYLFMHDVVLPYFENLYQKSKHKHRHIH
jgi:hypothetical protein